jgi:mRNA interferase RelE/StbE
MIFDFSNRAKKEIKHLNEPNKSRILDGIYNLPDGDVRPLVSYGNLFRLRLGQYRVIFSYVNAETILIEKVEPRGQVYKGAK